MSNTNFEFEVLIDDLFDNLKPDDFTLLPTDNKEVLSLVNDFEDGSWRYEKFKEFVFKNLPETALSKEERESLVDFTKLREATKKLRLSDEHDSGKSGEVGEIILYGIMKNYYGALPIVPKIFYKQNRQDFAKGADSVHIVIENNDDFSLWLGEAKFYTNISSAMNKAILSIQDLLSLEKLKKENSIITNLKDLDIYLENNPSLLNKIKSLLNQNTSIDNLKPKLHIPILLLHGCDITKNTTEMSEEYKNSIKIYHIEQAKNYFTKQINQLSSIHKYESIKFHLILFPVPEKKRIADNFIETVSAIRSV